MRRASGWLGLSKLLALRKTPGPTTKQRGSHLPSASSFRMPRGGSSPAPSVEEGLPGKGRRECQMNRIDRKKGGKAPSCPTPQKKHSSPLQAKRCAGPPPPAPNTQT